ncbi:hypothetical protein MMC26_003275 [Xylographa opegraphella]|nr:hypothetical protein [Xylographa opegraphella]
MDRLTSHFGVCPDLIKDLVLANRILAHHNVLDTFGHISARCHIRSKGIDEDCYLQATYHAPSLVHTQDIALFSVRTGESVDPEEQRKGPLERHIHAGLYRARPDVQAVLHCHAPMLVTYSVLANAGTMLQPVLHVGASAGRQIPIYEISDHFGHDTDLLVKTPELGDDLAKLFGSAVSMVLMRGHGATIASQSNVKDLVHKGIYAVINATIMRDATLLGAATGSTGVPRPLSNGEVEACGDWVSAVHRSWPAWVAELGLGKDESL